MFKSLPTMLIVRKVLAVSVGIIAIAWPRVTVLALVILLALYAWWMWASGRSANGRRLRAGDGVGGIEEDLLQRTGQVRVPHQGRGSRHRAVVQADRDHAADVCLTGQPDYLGPSLYDCGGPGQDRDWRVRGPGQCQRHVQRVPQRLIAELKVWAHGAYRRDQAS